ncbi:hypothetical protein TNCV_3762691 [Trichonephila clavipes]|nr:hypothetical protein TNCV_3762691 [Trichonephila clavipes]
MVPQDILYIPAKFVHGNRGHLAEEQIHVKLSSLKVLTLVWCGSYGHGVPSQISMSLDYESKLSGLSPIAIVRPYSAMLIFRIYL